MAATTSQPSSSSPLPEIAANPPLIREPASASARNRSPSSPSSPAASRPEPSSANSGFGSTNAHRPHQSIGSQRSGGFLAFVDRTIGEIRPRQSLSRISIGPDQFAAVQPSPERALRSARPASNYAAPVGLIPVADGRQPSPTLVGKPYSETDPSLPEPTVVPRLVDNKMHQTSSRLLRMTDDDRPFTKVRVLLVGRWWLRRLSGLAVGR
jgi:hypothetical protein